MSGHFIYLVTAHLQGGLLLRIRVELVPLAIDALTEEPVYILFEHVAPDRVEAHAIFWPYLLLTRSTLIDHRAVCGGIMVCGRSAVLMEYKEQHIHGRSQVQWEPSELERDLKRKLVHEDYETITGRSCQSLIDNPTSYEDLIHTEDRGRVLAKLDEATQTGQFNERFRIVCTHGEVRHGQRRTIR